MRRRSRMSVKMPTEPTAWSFSMMSAAESFTAIVSPLGELLGAPIRSGEGAVVADLDFTLIDQRKSKMDASGHYGRPELLSLLVDRTPASYVHDHVGHLQSSKEADHVLAGSAHSPL